MKQALTTADLDIDICPSLNHPLVQIYTSPGIEPTEAHIECVYQAIQYANEVLYGKE